MSDKEQELLKCLEEERNFIWDAVGVLRKIDRHLLATPTDVGLYTEPTKEDIEHMRREVGGLIERWCAYMAGDRKTL